MTPADARTLADTADQLADWTLAARTTLATLLADLAAIARHHADLLDAIGDPDDLRHEADCYEDAAGDLAAIIRRHADAIDAARGDRCACGQPATTTTAGIPTCRDDR